MWMFRIEEATGESTHTQPAAPLPIPMLLDLELPAGELEPYRENSATVEPIETTIPIETAQEWLRQKVGDTVVLESALVRGVHSQSVQRVGRHAYHTAAGKQSHDFTVSVYVEVRELHPSHVVSCSVAVRGPQIQNRTVACQFQVPFRNSTMRRPSGLIIMEAHGESINRQTVDQGPSVECSWSRRRGNREWPGRLCKAVPNSFLEAHPF